MDFPEKDDASKTQSIAAVIQNRGRRIDLYRYVLEHPEELTRGVLVAGSIGSGKTQKAMKIVLAALKSDFGVLIFDSSDDYNRLISVDTDAVIIDYREFTNNPLEPPTGMRFDEWAPTFIQVFAQNYGLKDPSIAILQKAANALTPPSPTTHDEPPVMEELLDEVRQYIPRQRSSEVSSHVSVQNRIESLLDSEVGKCVGIRGGFQPTDFENGLLIVRLPATGITRAHEFLVSITVAKLFAYRAWKRSHCEPSERNVLIVLEEAHNFLSEARRADRRGERSHLERALIEGRKLGMGFMVIDQMPHQISSHVLGSCNMWIVGKLMDPHAKRVIGDALCLDAVWSREGLITLPIGGAYIRVEHMKELEAESPLAHRGPIHGMEPWDSWHLPALVAVPEPENEMIHELQMKSVKEIMCKNGRYLRYFERNVRQFLEMLETPDYVRSALSSFLNRTLGKTVVSAKTLADYCKISSETVERFRNMVQRKSGKRESTSIKAIVYDLENRCRILTSNACMKVLAQLEASKEMSTGELVKSTGLSISWLSRVLNMLGSRGHIKRMQRTQRGHANYAMTEHGKELISWGQTVLWLADTKAQRSIDTPIVELRRDDVEWLMELQKEELDLRERSHIAGWVGSDDTRGELQNILFRAETVMALGQLGNPNSALSHEKQIFRRLLAALECDVLKEIILLRAPISYNRLRSATRLNNRSVRRHLSVLEEIGILDRRRKSEGWFISIDSTWKRVLLDDCSPSKQQIRLPIDLAKKMLKHAIDSVLLEMFIEHSYDHETFDYVIGRCLRLESDLN
ncbi:MAG: ATP-binding protein [Candidatus Thorarchaeota archaeon]